MEEFIKMASQQLGIDEAGTRSATGGILNIVKEQIGEGDFSDMASKLPGLDGLLNAAPADTGGGGGLLGAAASMLGGKAGAALDITKVLKGAGLDLDKGGPLIAMLVSFLKDKLGDSTVSKILEQVPGLGGEG